ncbi:MFS transporter [Streptacidiphilus monticola]|uniref:MFS transporter n=1 Tax=Streptacidiphilus monticola TaxID=2161674 RepID=A0ABW1G3B8_9ACTN
MRILRGRRAARPLTGRFGLIRSMDVQGDLHDGTSVGADGGAEPGNSASRGITMPVVVPSGEHRNTLLGGRASVESAGAGPGLFASEHRATTVTFVVVMFLTGFAALAVVPSLPTAAKALNGVPLFPLVAGCFVAAGLLGGGLGGQWADRAGARRPLALGMVLSVLALLVSASSLSIWQLAVGRFLDGLASGMVAVSVTTVIGQAYPERLQPRMLAMMSASWIVPSLVGPPIAGLVVQFWSWRAVFYGLAVLTVLPALVLVRVLRSRSKAGSSTAKCGMSPDGASVEARAGRPPLFGAAMLSLGAALGQYGVSSWDRRHLAFLLAGVGLLAGFASRLLPPGTWRSARGLPTAVLLRGLSSGTYFTLEALVPLMLVTERRVPAVVVSVAFTACALLWAGASWIQGRLLQDVSRHRLVMAGALILATAAACAAVGCSRSAPALMAEAAMPLSAVGMGLLDPCVTVLSLKHSPPERRGHTSGALQTNKNLGQVVVLGLASAVVNISAPAGVRTLGGYGLAFALLLAPPLLISVLAARARGDRAEPDRAGGELSGELLRQDPGATGAGQADAGTEPRRCLR